MSVWSNSSFYFFIFNPIVALIIIKGAVCSFGQEMLFQRERSFFMSKQTNNKLETTTQFHAVLLCLYVADPATFLASNSVMGTLFSSGNSLFIHLWTKKEYFWVCIINSLIPQIDTFWDQMFPTNLRSVPLTLVIDREYANRNLLVQFNWCLWCFFFVFFYNHKASKDLINMESSQKKIK